MHRVSFPQKVAATCAVAAITCSAHAAFLAPNSAIGLSFENEPLGATLVTSLISPFAGINFLGLTNFTGTLASSVYSGDTSNPFGGLTFTYLLSNSSTSADALARLTLSSFASQMTDVGYKNTGIIPLNVVRDAGGDQIAFNLLTPLFQHSLTPGASTVLLTIQTGATGYNTGNASVIDSATANVPALVPTSIVPEPGVLSLAGLGLAATLLRRKSKA